MTIKINHSSALLDCHYYTEHSLLDSWAPNAVSHSAKVHLYVGIQDSAHGLHSRSGLIPPMSPWYRLSEYAEQIGL
jgi:hypothetical protein